MRSVMRPALTMLELVLVIVILGIVASVGATLIADVYESYIIQRAQHRASIKTELAALQIANRLSHAIPGTVIRRVGTGGAAQDINDIPTAGTDPDVLQWVGADIDSFQARTVGSLRPGWDGFVDVDNTPLGGNTVSTPGSDLGLATTVIGNLGGNINNAAIFYRVGNVLQRRDIKGATSTGETIGLDNPVSSISEHYKLAWTSYALEARANGDLVLHYDFNPTRGTNITNTKQQILLRNVTTFQMRGDGRTIRFKICVEEQTNQADFNVTICKEKAVF